MTVDESEWTPLRLGADVVQILLPHRRPFLLVDAIDGLSLGPRPSLRARKVVSSNEPIFDGHFPGLALWPGVYTIEGLGQATNLLNLLVACVAQFERAGLAPGDLYEALKGIDARARRGPRKATELEQRLIEGLGEPRARIGYAGAVDMKLIEPVFAGATIEYRVTRTHVLANATRYDVEATVDERPVARGSMTSATP